MSFRWDVVWRELPQFGLGLANSAWLSTVAMTLSLLLGPWLALPLVSRRPVVRGASRAVVDVARCVPFLLLAYFVYFALPALGVRLDKWTASLVTLTVYNTAYIAEIVRGAWAQLPAGQTEAARAVGFTGFRLVRRIVLPQIALAAGPVFGNQLIQLIKDSAFLSIITVPELTYAANAVQSFYFVPFESFAVATLLYWALCAGVEQVVRWSEGRAQRIRYGA